MHTRLTLDVESTLFRPFGRHKLSMNITSMLHAPSVLCVGNDATLLQTRELLLGNSGYQVTAWSASELLDRPLPSDLNGIVICHSITGKELNEVLAWLEERISRNRVLLTEPLYGFERSFDGYCITASDRPESLLQALSKMIRSSANTDAAGPV